MAEAKAKHEESTKAAASKHAAKVTDLEQQHKAYTTEVQRQAQNEIKAARKQFSDTIQKLNHEHLAIINDLESRYKATSEAERQQHQNALADAEARFNRALNKRCQELTKKFEIDIEDAREQATWEEQAITVKKVAAEVAPREAMISDLKQEVSAISSRHGKSEAELAAARAETECVVLGYPVILFTCMHGLIF